MGQEALQGILSALTAAHQRGMQRAQLAQEAAREQTRSEEEQQRIELAKQRQKDEHEHTQALIKASAANAALSHIVAQQNIAAGIKRGLPVSGDQVVDIPGSAGAYQQHTLNMGEGQAPLSFQLPSREEMLQQDVQEQNLTEGPDSPKAKAKMAETEAQKLLDYQRFKMQKDEDDKRAEMTRKSAETIAAAHDRTTLAAAGIKARNSQTSMRDADQLHPFVTGALKGDYSLDDIKKLATNKQEMQAIESGVTAVGGTFFTPKQKQIKQDFISAAQLIPQFDSIAQIIKDNPYESRIPLTEAHNQVQQQIASVREKLINSLTAFGQGGRLSDPRVKALTDAFAPSLKPNADLANGKAKKDFQQYLSDTIDAHLSTLSKTQRDITKADVLGVSQPQAPKLIRARDPQGQLHEAPEGSSLPQGWKLEQ